jgi:peptidylprolyl isomerase
MAVKNGDIARVHYKGTLRDGTMFDTSVDREPMEFTVGAGQVIPGFESAILGLEPNGTVTVTIEPEDAYGPHIPELSQAVSVEDFGAEPYVGGIVNLVSPEGDELPGRIVAIDGDSVTLDFNHPLAGEALVFEIELVGIGPVPESAPE